METKAYDVLVIGSGEGGKYLAWKLAQHGQKVAVIERKYIGGSCPNIACLPSKNIIYSAKVASLCSRSREFGISADKWKIDMAAVRERKRKMVDELIDMHLDIFNKSGAELINGMAQFIDPHTLQVTDEKGQISLLSANKIILSMGSRSFIDTIKGLHEAKPMTHIEALELDIIPAHLIILGGGYIGLELAQAMRRFGSEVTIIERNPRLAHREDEDVSEALQQLFNDEGIRFHLNTRVEEVKGVSGQSVALHVIENGVPQMITGTHLLAATGRTPNTSDMGLELAGVELTPKGHVKVNDRLETTIPHIWAVGDCAGSPHFTHIAFDDFRIVLENILGGNKATAGRQVPYCMFTDPELARIGLSETEARAKNIPYRLAKIPMSKALRTRTLSETRGFMKALIDAKSDHILGFCVFGVEAGEIMGAVQVAMLGKLPYTALKNAIFTHPTLLEGLIPLFSEVPISSC